MEQTPSQTAGSWILIVRERGSSWAGRPPFLTRYASWDEAFAAVVAYVRENWKAHFENEIPEDETDLVDEYFADVLEDFEIVRSGGKL